MLSTSVRWGLVVVMATVDALEAEEKEAVVEGEDRRRPCLQGPHFAFPFWTNLFKLAPFK